MTLKNTGNYGYLATCGRLGMKGFNNKVFCRYGANACT